MKLRFGYHGEQGWRQTMEDEEVAIGDIHDTFKTARTATPHAFFGVFDGHCGNLTSQYLKDHLAENFVKDPFFEVDPVQAFKSAFGKTDEELRRVEETESGSTAVTVLVRGEDVWCGNLGDSRAVLCEEGCAIALSVDHKPDDSSEKRRIEDLGGFVEMGRVNGILAVSRAFGDFEYKQDGKNLVDATPEVEHRKIGRFSEFMILACDGLWDVFTNQDAVDMVSAKLKEGLTETQVAEFMCKNAIERRGSTDNVTVLLVVFDHSA